MYPKMELSPSFCSAVDDCGYASRRFEVAASLVLRIADEQCGTHGEAVADGADLFGAVGNGLLLFQVKRAVKVHSHDESDKTGWAFLGFFTADGHLNTFEVSQCGHSCSCRRPGMPEAGRAG